MFGFVTDILLRLLSLEDEVSNFNISTKAYYAITIIMLALYLAFNVAIYLFMALGLKYIYKKRGLDKGYLVWIPMVQIYALIRSFSFSKIYGIKKNTYALIMLIVTPVYFIATAVVDIFYFAPDICDFIFNGSAMLSVKELHWAVKLVDYVYYLFLLGFIGTVIAFFKERTPNSIIWLSILCVIFVDLFPIFVFVYRKKELVDWGRFKVVYTNYGNYEKPASPQKPKDEPFADFNQPKPDYSEPFAEFNKVEKPKQTSGESSTIPEDDDDLFN